MRQGWWVVCLALVGCAALDSNAGSVGPTLLPPPQTGPATRIIPPPQIVTPAILGGTTPTPDPELCAAWLPGICWNASEQTMVAHICYDEARGLGMTGMASCAAAIAQRQLRPELWGSASLEELLRPDQFAVPAASTRPWRQHLPPPPEALDSVKLFLISVSEIGCWRFDSFQASTPEAARQWQKQAPEWHCVVIVEPQAMLFFNWRDG